VVASYTPVCFFEKRDARERAHLVHRHVDTNVVDDAMRHFFPPVDELNVPNRHRLVRRPVLVLERNFLAQGVENRPEDVAQLVAVGVFVVRQ
jgi:hypothetical protein